MLATVVALYNTAGLTSPAPWERRHTVMTVRVNHLRVALLALAAAGMLAAVGLVVLYAQPAQANYPGTSGKIYYARPDANNRLQIYTINRNGNNNVKVTDNQLGQPPEAGNQRPAYSPTGRKIAYQGWDGNDFEIYTADLDDGDRFQVTNNDARDENPYFSPDGQRIAFSSNRNGNFDIYTINRDRSDSFQVTNTSQDERNPAYKPSGHKIAYSRNDGNDNVTDWEIYTIDTLGLASSTKNITQNPNRDDEDPDYSPIPSINGHRIAYSSFPLQGSTGDADIFTIREDGSGRINVTNNNNSDDFWPSYSPGGNSIAYVSGPANGDTEIFWIPKDGDGTREQVTDNKTPNLNPYWGCEGGCN
jgi:Tol biopolymer transport system component